MHNSLKKIQQEELKMLRAFTEYCDINKLRYYLAGGTVLGAVRHQGFIPWDDDIDVIMPRPDYEKFIELTQSNMCEQYEVCSAYYSETCVIPYMKIVNPSILISDDVLREKQPLWMDVFPMDGMPEDKKELEKHIKKIAILNYMLWQSTITEQRYKSKWKKFIKTILFFPLKLIGSKCFVQKIKEESMKYSFTTSRYVGCAVGKYGIKEVMLKEIFVEREKLAFEGEMYYVSKGYEKYLENLYGDYMTIPTDQEKHSHLVIEK